MRKSHEHEEEDHEKTGQRTSSHFHKSSQSINHNAESDQPKKLDHCCEEHGALEYVIEVSPKSNTIKTHIPL